MVLLFNGMQSSLSHVHSLADQGLTVLWATHLTDEVRDTDHRLVLHQGQILADGTALDVRGDIPLSDKFLAMTGAST